jgi:hypothetical protein
MFKRFEPVLVALVLILAWGVVTLVSGQGKPNWTYECFISVGNVTNKLNSLSMNQQASAKFVPVPSDRIQFGQAYCLTWPQ